MRAIFLLLTIAFFAPLDVGATTCISDGSQRTQVRAAFEAAEVVFSAYVLEVSGGSNGPTAKLKVLQVWKGSFEVGQVVEATAGESVHFISDGVVPSPGSALLVYSSSSQPFILHVCSRTGVLDSATADIPLLNKLSKKRRYNLGG